MKVYTNILPGYYVVRLTFRGNGREDFDIVALDGRVIRERRYKS